MINVFHVFIPYVYIFKNKYEKLHLFTYISIQKSTYCVLKLPCNNACQRLRVFRILGEESLMFNNPLSK